MNTTKQKGSTMSYTEWKADLSWKQNEDFIKAIIRPTFLNETIEWIKQNLDIEDVYTVTELEEWAEESGYTKEGGDQ